MRVSLDVGAVVAALAWPIAVVVLGLVYRSKLEAGLGLLATRIRSLSVGGVSLELTDVTSDAFAPTGGSAVDLRHAGKSEDINDSTLRSFYTQLDSRDPIPYAVVDLGTGDEWLTSRLFVLSVIMRRMRGLQAVIFVETLGHHRRRYVGTCDAERLRWRLSKRYSLFEGALSWAEGQVWLGAFASSTGQPVGPAMLMALRRWYAITDDNGRIEFPNQAGSPPAADLLRLFLEGIQMDGPPRDPDWVQLDGSSPLRSEFAQWVSGALVQELTAGVLDTAAVPLESLVGRPEVEKVQLISDHSGRWVAVLRADGSFDRLIDRSEVLARLLI